jgi:hypothetical protein
MELAGVGGGAGQSCRYRLDGRAARRVGAYQLHGDGPMKIRKVPADWLDAPRPRGRKSVQKRRGSPDGRGHRQPGKSGQQERRDPKTDEGRN